MNRPPVNSTPSNTPRRYQLPQPTAELTDKILMDAIEPHSRVLDLGCGDGRLLGQLRDELFCNVQGVELALDQVLAAIGRGVPTIQADLDQGLPEFPDGSFDFAVLSETLQQVRQPKDLLLEMLRIAKWALVVVPNFGHWRVRMSVAWKGRAPVTAALPYEWFDTPNQRFMSLHDFRDLLKHIDCQVIKEVPIVNGRAVERAWAANLRADSVMYVFTRNQ